MAGPAQAEPLLPGGISLQMTECDVVHRAGPVAKMELGTTGRGERSLVLTYLAGPWPAETAALLDAIDQPVYRVRGNADRELVGAAQLKSLLL